MADTVMVYTSRQREQVFEDGGSGDWSANAAKVVSCTYIVLVKSDTYANEFAKNDILVGSAFLIGKVAGTREAQEGRRLVITFSEYAEINLPGAWPGNRNPVAYLNIRDLEERYQDFSLAQLTWHPFPFEKVKEVDTVVPLTLAEAKLGLAKALKIDPSQIEIRITA